MSHFMHGDEVRCGALLAPTSISRDISKLYNIRLLHGLHERTQ